MNDYKICPKCKQTKYKDKYSTSKFALKSGRCRECIGEDSKLYRETHKEEVADKDHKYYEDHKAEIKIYNKIYQKENKEEIKEYKKVYREENKEKIKIYSKQYYWDNRNEMLFDAKQYQEDHKEETKEYKSKYQKDNNEKINARSRQRRKEDPAFRMRCFLSAIIGSVLKSRGSSKNGYSVWDHLNYNQKQLWDHIKSQFEPWMNENNQGIYDPKTWNDNDPSTWKWQLDHIIPHSTFYYTTMDCDEFRECWALSNLRPYSAKQNILDGTSRIRHKIF